MKNNLANIWKAVGVVVMAKQFVVLLKVIPFEFNIQDSVLEVISPSVIYTRNNIIHWNS